MCEVVSPEAIVHQAATEPVCGVHNYCRTLPCVLNNSEVLTNPIACGTVSNRAHRPWNSESPQSRLHPVEVRTCTLCTHDRVWTAYLCTSRVLVRQLSVQVLHSVLLSTVWTGKLALCRGANVCLVIYIRLHLLLVTSQIMLAPHWLLMVTSPRMLDPDLLRA